MTEKQEAIEVMKGWLEHSPATPAATPPTGLNGWTGLVTACVTCTGRIAGRGCHFATYCNKPVWDDEVACELCGQKAK